MKKQNIKQPITNGYAKVPVVMQMEALECGAASLTMILAYYEKWISKDTDRRSARGETSLLLPRARGHHQDPAR